eukprot:gene29435-35528_t
MVDKSWFLLIFLFVLCLASPTHAQQEESPQQRKNWMAISERKWDREWKAGMWEYMESVPAERARIAVIGSVLVPSYTPLNASVLDVGCGEGAIADFLTGGRKEHFVGIDISSEAIQLAIKKRGPPMTYIHSPAHSYTTSLRFDAIIFSEVLYYVNYAKILQHYEEFLAPNGVFIISIYYQQNHPKYFESIFNYARERYESLDEMFVEGYTTKMKGGKREKTSFRVEVFRRKQVG